MLRKNILFLLIFGLASVITANAQTYKSTSWSYNFFLAGSNMVSDLGGTDLIGNDGIWDLDLKATRLAIGTGVSFNVGSFSFSPTLLYTRLAGNDEWTIQEFQNTRNLSVRTDLLEGSFTTEFRPFSHSYVLSRFYLYGGVGGIYYQPKAEYNDEWVKLRPLGTEGQNFIDTMEQYSELGLVVPIGLGYKFRLGRSTSLVVDLGWRKTFTDYLDDVSTVYVDPALLLADGGQTAVDLADRSGQNLPIGYERGNPDKLDSYFILAFKFEKVLGDNGECYYNKNPKKRRGVKLNQKKMFIR